MKWSAASAAVSSSDPPPLRVATPYASHVSTGNTIGPIVPEQSVSNRTH